MYICIWMSSGWIDGVERGVIDKCGKPVIGGGGGAKQKHIPIIHFHPFPPLDRLLPPFTPPPPLLIPSGNRSANRSICCLGVM